MTSIKETQWQAAADAVRDAERILIVTHISPDGDAIGSMLGMANAFREMGKQVDCAVDEGVPDDFLFLSGADAIQATLTEGDWDLLISTDASDEERTGAVGVYGREHSAKVINLDHHPTNTMFGDIYLIDSEAVSAAQVVYEWLLTMDAPITEASASALLTGMVTDTRGFRTSNVTAQTLSVAQALMDYGPSLTGIIARTLDTRSYLSVNLWKQALTTVELHAGGVVSANVTQEALKKAGLRDTSDFGLVGFLMEIKEAMIAVVFKETPEGEVVLSMRAKPGYNVASVALELGGGGHTQAAGATVPGPLNDARKRVLPMLKRAAKSGKLVIA
jgi:phosphoesterase RecJ-like protein